MDRDGHWGYGFAHHHHGPGIVGGLLLLLLVALAIAALVWLVMQIRGLGTTPQRSDSALETLLTPAAPLLAYRCLVVLERTD